ncbi:hypothetical protein FKM82_000597 [Ascaphus truei]
MPIAAREGEVPRHHSLVEVSSPSPEQDVPSCLRPVEIRPSPTGVLRQHSSFESSVQKAVVLLEPRRSPASDDSTVKATTTSLAPLPPPPASTKGDSCTPSTAHLRAEEEQAPSAACPVPHYTAAMLLLLLYPCVLSLRALQFAEGAEVSLGSCAFENNTCAYKSAFTFLPWLLNVEGKCQLCVTFLVYCG